MNSTKTILTFVAIALLIVALVLLWGGGANDDVDTPESISGTISVIDEPARTVTIAEVADTQNGDQTISVPESANVVDTNGSSTDFSELRVGIDVLITLTADPLVAESVTILDAPDVLVRTPQPNEHVTLPLQVEGEARGTWYFEADFPVELVVAGDVVGGGIARAQGDWMTEDYVAFEATVTAEGSIARTGDVPAQLRFVRANPSGLPENADEISVPIQLRLAEDTRELSVFFPDAQRAQVGDCSVVNEYQRTVQRTQAPARQALQELILGPTDEEQAAGVSSSIPSSVAINRLVIDGGTAEVDFSSQLNQVAGSCAVTAVRSQIEATLSQFDTVDEVVISVEGSIEAALQP